VLGADRRAYTGPPDNPPIGGRSIGRCAPKTVVCDTRDFGIGPAGHHGINPNLVSRPPPNFRQRGSQTEKTTPAPGHGAARRQGVHWRDVIPGRGTVDGTPE